jgi:hypothetical protein
LNRVEGIISRVAFRIATVHTLHFAVYKSGFGPKQESTIRPVPEDQRKVARALGSGRADGLAGHIKAARVVLG